MNVKQLHDLLAEAIQEGNGGALVLLSDAPVDGVARYLDKQLVPSFVLDNGNDYNVLEETEVEKGYYENQDYQTAYILVPEA